MTAIATTHWAGHPRHHEPRAGKHRAGKKRHAGKVLLGAALMRAMSEGRHGRHGGHRGHGPGHGWTGPGAFGLRGRFRPYGLGSAEGRARRGDVRSAMLVLLAEEPRNGYQLMQEIEERSDGAWPRAPARLPRAPAARGQGARGDDERDGRQVYEITDAGRARVAERRERPAPWETAAKARAASAQLSMQLAWPPGAGRPRRRRSPDRRGPEVLTDARRSLYRILAGDAGDEPAAD